MVATVYMELCAADLGKAHLGVATKSDGMSQIENKPLFMNDF